MAAVIVLLEEDFGIHWNHKLIVCESCEAEFRIKHSLDERYYKEIYCPFCGEELQEELEDELEDFDE